MYNGATPPQGKRGAVPAGWPGSRTGGPPLPTSSDPRAPPASGSPTRSIPAVKPVTVAWVSHLSMTDIGTDDCMRCFQQISKVICLLTRTTSMLISALVKPGALLTNLDGG